MMGGRGGVILSKQEYGKKINSAVFPGCQGTSAVNLIAAKAVIFKLAMKPEFIHLQKKTLGNAAFFATELAEKGFRIVSEGTDTHQVLVDLTSIGLEGDAVEKTLESVGIILNRNVIPRDAESPGRTSGIRLGSAAISMRGMGKKEIVQIAGLMNTAMLNHDSKDVLAQVSKEVTKICRGFPVYG